MTDFNTQRKFQLTIGTCQASEFLEQFSLNIVLQLSGKLFMRLLRLSAQQKIQRTEKWELKSVSLPMGNSDNWLIPVLL